MLETVLDDPLLDHILAIQDGQREDFWSFKSSVRRRYGAHALIHYPAMMVPTLQGKLLDAIKLASPEATDVLDPFVGSGTILVESMSRGLNFTGIDINPLAALACLAKSGPYFIEAFHLKMAKLHARICCDRRRKYYVNFDGQEKWFDSEVSTGISLVARNIEAESSLWARRLFWLALAKVIRTTCNSRMSTYKLHLKKASPTATAANPLKLFEDTLERFAGHLREQHATWTGNGFLQHGRYTGEVDIHLGDSCKVLDCTQLKNKFDVVMTSPPYGDNRTTIPYGQYSYLPMKWIPTEDVCPSADATLLDNTHAIDTASLGGSLRRAIEKGQAFCEQYESAKVFAHKLHDTTDRLKRFYAFFCDLETCVDKICDVTKQGGYQTWTIGSRQLGGRRVPMEDIVADMLAQRDTVTVGRIHRNIHAKKMATRNNVSATMSTETILLARKT